MGEIYCCSFLCDYPFSPLSPQDFCERGCRSSGLGSGSLSGTHSCDILSGAREQPQAKAGSAQSACGVEDVLQLLRILFIIGGEPAVGRTLQEGKPYLKHKYNSNIVHRPFAMVQLSNKDIFVSFKIQLGISIKSGFSNIKMMQKKAYFIFRSIFSGAVFNFSRHLKPALLEVKMCPYLIQLIRIPLIKIKQDFFLCRELYLFENLLRRFGWSAVQCITRGVHQQKNYNQNSTTDWGNKSIVNNCKWKNCSRLSLFLKNK